MRGRRLFGTLVWAVAFPCLPKLTLADDVVYRYECDVLPPEAGWITADPCSLCALSTADGQLSLRWGQSSDFVNFHRWITPPENNSSPDSLWVEWRLWSNNPIPRTDDACDARVSIHYRTIAEVVYSFADAAVSFEGGQFVLGLDSDEFHTYRLQTLDGNAYSVAVDGRKFIYDTGDGTLGSEYMQFSGKGGCTLSIDPRINRWDFVRYGTIASGEKVVSSDPPAGFVDARNHASLDRFTVTFDSANYVYVNDITVETTGGEKPIIKATRRLDNGEPDTVEIVLDRPMPLGETTRFTMTDGVAVNVVEYTYAPGDANGNGQVDLFDAAVMQNCFGTLNPTGLCAISDLTRDGIIDLADHAWITSLLDGP